MQYEFQAYGCNIFSKTFENEPLKYAVTLENLFKRLPTLVDFATAYVIVS